MVYTGLVLAVASRSELEICSLTSDQFGEEGETIIEADDLKIRKIIPGLNILGLPFSSSSQESEEINVALETKDNLIDFSTLHIEEGEEGDEDNWTYKFQQNNEMIPRKNH